MVHYGHTSSLECSKKDHSLNKRPMQEETNRELPGNSLHPFHLLPSFHPLDIFDLRYLKSHVLHPIAQRVHGHGILCLRHVVSLRRLIEHRLFVPRLIRVLGVGVGVRLNTSNDFSI